MKSKPKNGPKMGYYTEKDECFACGRWNKPSVRFCKCGIANPDHELYGHVNNEFRTKGSKVSQSPTSEDSPF